MEDIRKFAIEEDNSVMSRNVLRGMNQDPGETIKHFAYRIKSQVKNCNFTIKCTATGCGTIISYANEEIEDQIYKVLVDTEIQQDII